MNEIKFAHAKIFFSLLSSSSCNNIYVTNTKKKTTYIWYSYCRLVVSCFCMKYSFNLTIFYYYTLSITQKSLVKIIFIYISFLNCAFLWHYIMCFPFYFFFCRKANRNCERIIFSFFFSFFEGTQNFCVCLIQRYNDFSNTTTYNFTAAAAAVVDKCVCVCMGVCVYIFSATLLFL